MKILSVLVGKPKLVGYLGKEISTGIFKSSVQGPVRLGFTNLEGDGQADLKVHGGREKALYAYGYERSDDWKKVRPDEELAYGAFGENLSVDTLPEDRIFVGDVYRLGGSRVQACQPRFPCQKLAVKFQDAAILKQFNDFGKPGVYYRVIEEGLVAAGDSFELLDRDSVPVSILELFFLKRPEDDEGRARVREILKNGAHAESWRKKLSGWLD